MKKKLIPPLLVIMAFALYGNSILNKYSLDDHLVNHRNPLVANGIEGIPEIFKNLSFREKNFSYAFRPVLLSSFAIEQSLFKSNPHASHFINISLYAFFCIILFYFMIELFPEKTNLIFLTLLLFLVHPLHSEIVNNIKSRDELLAAIFGLGMVHQYLKFISDKNFYRTFLILIFFLSGLLSKTSVFYFAAMLPFIHFLKFFPAMDTGQWKILASTLLLLGGAFLSLNYAKEFLLNSGFQGRQYLFYENPLVDIPLLSRIPAALGICLYNLKLLVWPFTLSFYYGYNHVSIFGWDSIIPYLSLLIHLFLLFLFFRFFSKNKFFTLALFFYFINIFLTSNFLVLVPGIVGERFLFFASIGQSMVFAFFLFKVFEKTGLVKGDNRFFGLSMKSGIVSMLILLTFSIKVFSRNKAWADEFTLIKTDADHLLNSAKVNDMMALQLLSQIKTEKNVKERNILTQKAIRHCNNCLYIFNRHITCWNNLGTLYFSKREFVKAELCFRKTLSIDSSDPNPMFNLAHIHQTKSNYPTAKSYYEKAIAANPDLKDLLPMYKQFVLKNNAIPEAIRFINKMINGKFSGNYNLHLLMVDFYYESKDYNNVLLFLKKAYAIKQSTEIAEYIDKLTKIAEQ